MFTPVSLRRARRGVDPHAVEYTVIDVETTGLDPRRGHRVCEIAAVRMRADGIVLEEFASVVNPQRRMSSENQEFHGISNAEAAAAPTFAELAGTLLRLMRGAVVVAHNLEFEGKFLTAEFAHAGLPQVRAGGLCTLETYREHTEMIGYRLPGIVKSLSGSWPGTEHAALEDARNTARVLTALLTTAPVALTLSAGPSGNDAPAPSAPSAPEAARVRPRACGLRKGREGWLAHLRRALPTRTRTPLDEVGASAYRAAVARHAEQGRLIGRDAEELAALASVAGHSQESLRAAHTDVWKELRARAGAHPDAPALRSLTAAALLLDVPHLNAQLPSVGTELKGFRVVPLGDTPAVRSVVALAERHGAPVGVRPSRTTRMVIVADEVAAPHTLPAESVQVLRPAAAEAALRELIARHAAERAAERPADAAPQEPDSGRLIIENADVAMLWRGHVPAKRPRTTPATTDSPARTDVLVGKAADMFRRGLGKREVARSLRAEGLGFFERRSVMARARAVSAA
ncbi:3'-5' exonuclease [Streptomyces kanamyceticus]|nr:3'-5' exonuclease [Streptomyces kanamyceticus]